MCKRGMLDATQDEEGEGPGDAPMSHSVPWCKELL